MFSETKRSRKSRDERNAGEGAIRRVYDVAADGLFLYDIERPSATALYRNSLEPHSNETVTQG
jgi:hypothetical protein